MSKNKRNKKGFISITCERNFAGYWFWINRKTKALYEEVYSILDPRGINE